MDPTTLYYTLSTIPQVIGAIAAIVAAFTHFRIEGLRQYLVGDGRSVLNRWGDIGYVFLEPAENERQRKRLIDAVDRQSVPEIKNVIFALQNIEKTQGYSKKDRPTGLQYLFEDRFCGTEAHIARLKRSTWHVIAFSFASVFLSVLSLAVTDIIVSAPWPAMGYLSVGLNVGLFAFSLILAVRLIRLGLSDRTVHETDRAIPSVDRP